MAIAAAILVIGSWTGVWAVQTFRAAGGAQYFYQPDFGPAVMLACGRTFGDPDTVRAPALAAFLEQRTNTFNCADIPAALRTATLNPFQSGIRYLEIAVALTWRVTGVSWARLGLLNGVLFGSVAVLTFGLLRLALPRALALLMFVPSVTSTPNFMLVPQLRDYAKGPFLLATILIMGVLVVRCADRRRAVMLAVLAGATVGVGFGFRADLAVAIVPVLVTLLLLVPPQVTVGGRAAASVAFIATFTVTAFPVLRGHTAGGNNGHVMLLGLTSEFDRPLRIEPSVYRFGGRYLDSSAFTTIDSYAVRVEGLSVEGMSPQYERVAGAYLARIGETFPGDVLTRVASATYTISKYFLDSSLYPPIQVRSERARSLYSWRARVWWRLGEIAFVACAAAAMVTCAVHPRAAWLALLVMVAFAGPAALQFDERHFYYLQFVPWLAFGLLIHAVIRWRSLARLAPRARSAMIAISAAVFVIGGGTLGLARVYQQRSATQLFARFEGASRSVIDTVRLDSGHDRTLFSAREWWRPLSDGSPTILTQFLAVRLHDEQCSGDTLPITIRYDGHRRDADLSETVLVRLSTRRDGGTVFFVAAYDWSNDYIRFRGIEVPSRDVDCIADVSRVRGLDREPLLLTTTLRPGWRAEPLYERFK